MIVSAAILARGLGTRMRKQDPSTHLAVNQATVADAGVKAMIPIGRPFLDYALSALADAGLSRVCLVIGPEHDSIREHYTQVSPPSRISIEFAIQENPLGTADAVLSAEDFAHGEPFVVLNSDNYYPAAALARLRATTPPALIGFARSALVESGNVDPAKTERFGALEIDAEGFLVSITPRGDAAPRAGGREVYASMNCWLFDASIFDACRKVPMSPRGELELPRAVQMAIDAGEMKCRVIRMSAPVLDLSTRADIESVARKLQAVQVAL